MPVKTIKREVPPVAFEAYAYVVAPLSEEDGGGFLVSLPDLPGCVADGETELDAIAQAREAFSSWVSACVDRGQPVPPPVYRPELPSEASGRFVQRVPRSLHARLSARAKVEGVSLNTLVTTMIAEGLGRKEARG